MPCGDGCPDGAACVCGVCTTECAEGVDCGQHGTVASCVPLAARILEDRCDASAPASICDVECVEARDCAALGAGFLCASGYCRNGPSSAGSTSCVPSGAAPDQIVVLGDVLLELTPFTADLEGLAQAGGLLDAGAHYRSNAAAATSFLAEGPLGLGAQYATARAGGAARVVIMNGGATDMLNDPCASAATPECPAVQAAVRGAELLFAEFAADGVEHVVYLFYPDPIGNPALKAGLDTLRPLVENVCGKSRVACHWLDLRPAFAGHTNYLLEPDGIVFSDAGAQAAASAVFERMSCNDPSGP
jgi:hypothetical protein